jgi:hypothetical protein
MKDGWYIKFYCDNGDLSSFIKIILPTPLEPIGEEEVEENSSFSFLFFPGETEIPFCEWLKSRKTQLPIWKQKQRPKGHTMAEVQFVDFSGIVTQRYFVNYLNIMDYDLYGKGPLVEVYVLYRSITRDKTQISHHRKEDLPWYNESNQD